MKSIILKSVLGLTLLLTPTIETTAFNNSASRGGNVYICTGEKAYSYHKTNHCRGLNRCSASIKCVSLSYAKSIGRTPCGICY